MNIRRNARNRVSRERIGIAMSGGVDSTACALILREQAEIEGFFMRLAQPGFDRQQQRVTRLADRLAIPLTVIDLRQEFNRRVLDYFADTYFNGLTPNPCMVCNREIKFGLFLQAILGSGMDRMATGHYARIRHDSSGFHLLNGLDPVKNQSYFLARLTQEQLAAVIFPLGDRRKSEIYTLVKQQGFTDFEGIESQDVCFLANDSVGDYLEQRYPDAVRSGPILSTSGQEVGHHTGLFRYTIGQRRGLGIPDSSPWYVAGMDAASNTLIVGKPDDLLRERVLLGDVHWLSGVPPAFDQMFTVRIRYSHRGAPARIEQDPQSPEHIILVFPESQRAITPGQYAVIYAGDEVMGSGVILR